MSLAVLRPRVEGLVRAERVGAEAQLGIDQALQEAALIYSRRRPRHQVVDLTADGEWYLALPAEWVDEFSAIKQVEYPLGRRPPEVVSGREYWLYRTPDGETLAFRELTPGVGESVRVTFTAPHVLDEHSTTLPATSWDTVVKLAAGTVCLELAAFYSHTQHAGLKLDGVSHSSKATEFEKRGKAYRAEAERELPQLQADVVGAAGGEVSFAGEIPFLTH